MKDWTGRTHKVEVRYYKSEHPEWGEVWNVVGIIDGEERLLQYPFTSYEEARGYYWVMIRSIERWLDGQHHPLQYDGKWSYLARYDGKWSHLAKED